MPSPLPDATRQDATRSPLSIRLGFWICIAISVVVVLRRLYALVSEPASNAPPQLAAFDKVFASHAVLTLAHILPALLFVLLVPVIVFRALSRPSWIGRIFYPLGAIVGFTAYAMTAFSIGGWTERSAVLLFDSLFLFSLTRAWNFHRRRDIALERHWQLRAIAILLGIATTRPVMGIFFATARLTHLVPQQFFGIAFWIGFSINLLAFELWIRSVERNRSRSAAPLIRDPQARSSL